MLSRRTFLAMAAGGLAAATLPAATETLEASAAPDIVLFLVDDMGWQDTGVPFWYPNNGKQPRRTPLNERYQTPHQMRMASEGMLFSAAYAQPVCSPTRVSLLTGMNAARHGVTNWVAGVNRAPSDGMRFEGYTEARWAVNGLQPPGTMLEGVTRNAFNLPSGEYPATAEVRYALNRPYCCATTLPMWLKRAGYATILAGKAHFGAGDGFAETDAVTPGQNPRMLGFDVNLCGSHKGQPSAYRPESGAYYGGEVFGLEAQRAQGKMLTEALTREALAAVEAQDPAKPVFLYLSHFALHTPHHDAAARHSRREAREDPEDSLPWNALERNYCDLVEGIDASLGEVLDWAIDRKARTGREVLVLFAGDNGGLSEPGQRLGMGENQGNWPLRAGKGSCYEGGIRVPLIAWMPQRIKAGSVCHAPVICEDLFATVLDYAGLGAISPLDCAVTPPEGSVDGKARLQQVDGISLRKVLEGGRSLEAMRPILIHYPNLWSGVPGAAYNCYTALRMGEWKLIWHHVSGEMELYNVVSDVSEAKNQAKKRPSLVAKLAREMCRLLQERGAQLPRLDGEPLALPVTLDAHEHEFERKGDER